MLSITKSSHGQACIQIINPTEYQRNIIRSIVMNQWIESEDYKIKRTCVPFLQCDHSEYLLVEFWGEEESIQSFVDYLNLKLLEGEKHG